MSPGPELHVAVECRLGSEGALQKTSTKVFNISIVDRNDNSIRVQDSATNLTLNSPYFQKVSKRVIPRKYVKLSPGRLMRLEFAFE